MIKLLTLNNRPIEDGIRHILSKIGADLRAKGGRAIGNAMLWTTRNHFKTIYPNSQHYDPSKVNIEEVTTSNNPTATVSIDVPGICRAYHNHLIRPKIAKWLTIPIHTRAYGKKVREFNGRLFKPKGKNVLAINQGGKLVCMYALAKKAFQKKDPRLMPTNDTYFKNMISRIIPIIDESIAKSVNSV